MIADGAITPEERERMVLKSHLRRKGDLLAPFRGDRHFQHLTGEDIEMVALKDAAWADYETGRKQGSFRN